MPVSRHNRLGVVQIGKFSYQRPPLDGDSEETNRMDGKMGGCKDKEGKA